jgi:hypothetical protein
MPSEEGFYKRKGGSTNYVSILGIEDEHGKQQAVFAEKAEEGAKDAVSRVNKNGKTVWEKHYDALALKIQSVYIKEDKEYGNQLCIRGKTKTVQVSFNSAHAKKFVAVCRNINLDDVILLEPYKFPKEDANGRPVLDRKGQKKYNTGWTIKQGGDAKENKLEDALDMSKNGPVPAFEKLKNGKWDTSDHDEYLLNYLNEWIEENELNKRPEKVEQEDDDDEDEEEDEDEDEDEDEPPPKKVKGKVVSSKPLKKKKKRPVEEDEDEDEDEDQVPF